ncbi:MAG: DUF3105 domain-containing protein [Chloroflexi bacterium]|nr:DUF3105 domain-containing protein [Chloroflexota bacterium]MCH8310015.1 DUF3105 domain-containing protein [Chloroflexota bacterium]
MVDRKARYERRQRTRERRRGQSQRARLSNMGRNIMMVSGVLVIVVALIGGLYYYTTTLKELPPTAFGPTHSESFPPQQINTVPIPRPIQEHIMERGGRTHPTGGMLVVYNCVDYECDQDVVETLTRIVRSYPPQVYLAPFPTMDAKIALTSPGRRLTLDTLDENKIREFLDRNLTR